MSDSKHRAMVKWEHLVTHSLDHREIADLGQEGWQLVQVVIERGLVKMVIWKRIDLASE